MAINKSLRNILATIGYSSEHIFITSSEADSVAYYEGFASFKIPSKNIVAQSGLNPKRYRLIARNWIWDCVNIFNPNYFIVDTFPAGSFNELYDVLENDFSKIFIYRARKDFTKILKETSLLGYNKIIATLENNDDNIFLGTPIEEKVSLVGNIIQKNPSELFTKETAKLKLGIPQNTHTCLVMAGGGGDKHNEEFYKNLIPQLVAFPDVLFIIAAGALYKGEEFYASNVRWQYQQGFYKFINAFDFAISASGYNSVSELIFAKIPTLFFAQERKYDDQLQRVKRLESKGLCHVVESSNANEIINKFQILIDDNVIKDKLLQNNFQNFATQAAINILEERINTGLLSRAKELIAIDTNINFAEHGLKPFQFYQILFALDKKYQLTLNTTQNENSTDENSTDENYMTEDSINNYETIKLIHNLAFLFLKEVKILNLDFSLSLKYLKFLIGSDITNSLQAALNKALLDLTNWSKNFIDIKSELNNLGIK